MVLLAQVLMANQKYPATLYHINNVQYEITITQPYWHSKQNHKHTYSIFNSDISSNTAEHNHPYSIGNQSHSHHHRGSTNATTTTHNHAGSANSTSVSHTHTSDANSKSDGAHGHGTSGSDGSHPHNNVGTSHNSAVTRYFTPHVVFGHLNPQSGDRGVVGNVSDSGVQGL